jgi:hypothetical protein
MKTTESYIETAKRFMQRLNALNEEFGVTLCAKDAPPFLRFADGTTMGQDGDFITRPLEHSPGQAEVTQSAMAAGALTVNIAPMPEAQQRIIRLLTDQMRDQHGVTFRLEEDDRGAPNGWTAFGPDKRVLHRTYDQGELLTFIAAYLSAAERYKPNGEAIARQVITLPDTTGGPTYNPEGPEYTATIEDAGFSPDAPWIHVKLEGNGQAYGVAVGIQHGHPLLFLYNPVDDDPLLVHMRGDRLEVEPMSGLLGVTASADSVTIKALEG